MDKASDARRARNTSVSNKNEPLIRRTTDDEETAKRKALTEPDDVQEVGDMDALIPSKRMRATTVANSDEEQPYREKHADGGEDGSKEDKARTTDGTREKAADKAEARAMAARGRGVGDLSEAAKQEAAGTRGYFGASAAAKLRRQLAASLASSKRSSNEAANRDVQSTGSAATTSGADTSCTNVGRTTSATGKTDTPSEQPLPRRCTNDKAQDASPEENLWLCFPCLLKRGELSERIDNDVAQRSCSECNVCPQGIYKLSETPSLSSAFTWMPTGEGAEASTSSSSSTSTANVTTPCVWCLRFGIRTAPGNARCLELQREFGCHRCDKVGCCDANCSSFKRPRPNVSDAPTTGTAAADIFERTPVQIRRERGNLNVFVEFSGRSFIKGFASGDGYNCLIQTLLACLNDNGILCVADVPWIREELRRRFRTGENIVMAKNYLDLRNHWRSIIDLIGISARRNSCDPANQIHARNFNVTAVLEDGRFVAEKDGEGPISLFMLNEGNSHFVPLLRNRQRWMST